MLACRACFRRWLSPLESLDTPGSSSIRPRRNVNPLIGRAQQRLQSTDEIVRKFPSHKGSKALSKTERLERNKGSPWSSSEMAIRQNKQAKAALRDSGARNIDYLGKRDPTVSVSDWERRKRELRHLQDPLSLAEFVRKELKKDKVTEMLQLTRMASRSMPCIVSWNHIIDHLLSQGKVSPALKVYNDMKKRAQFPDSYTYTILLRGLSMNAQSSGVVQSALSIYHSLWAPNSRVVPTIMHTNAALRVCARANDMDALWGIAGKIPEKGPESANELTYATILGAIRQNILLNAPAGESEEEAARRKDRGVTEGRRTWEGIIARWRKADLKIDEELVCTMGRLLLVGARPSDWDDVLSLVEQTMDIPRLVPRIGTSERKEAGIPQLRTPNVSEEFHSEGTTSRGEEFLAAIPSGKGHAVAKPLNYAKPGNNTLSMITEACQKTLVVKASNEYWTMLTDPVTYNVQPDLNNLQMRLRILRQNRSSALALQLIQDDMIAKGIKPVRGTFRIAMSTCVRDKNNHNSLKNAGKILEVMCNTLEDVDAKAAEMYADLANVFPLGQRDDLIEALTRLNPVVKNLRMQLTVGHEDTKQRGYGAVYLTGEPRQDAISALRRVYGVYDKLLLSHMLEEKQKQPFIAERARLAAFLHRVRFMDDKKAAASPEGAVKYGKTETTARSDRDVKTKDTRGARGVRPQRDASQTPVEKYQENTFLEPELQEMNGRREAMQDWSRR